MLVSRLEINLNLTPNNFMAIATQSKIPEPTVQCDLEARTASAGSAHEVMAAVWTSVVTAQVRNGNHCPGLKSDTLSRFADFYGELAVASEQGRVFVIRSQEVGGCAMPDPILTYAARAAGIQTVSAMFPLNTAVKTTSRDDGTIFVEAVVPGSKLVRIWEKTDEGLWIRGLDEAGQPEEAETPIVKEPTNKRFLRGLNLSSFRNNPKN